MTTANGTTGNDLIEAATVVLLRQGPAGAECLMLRKNSGHAFGGSWVFPGGRVDRSDGEGLAGARQAAVRETAEEVGIVLDPKLLVPFSRWLPPSTIPRRFATWFFAGAMPQTAVDIVVDGSEIGDYAWLTPAAALGRHADDLITLAAPTWVTLHRLACYRDVMDVLTELKRADISYFTTVVVNDGTHPVALWPPDAAYEGAHLTTAGPRHRLRMGPPPWRYERSVDAREHLADCPEHVQ